MRKALKIFDFISYWSLILIPFSIAIAPAMTSIFMGFLLFAFLAKRIIKREKLFNFTMLHWVYIALMAWALFSFKNTIDPRVSFRGILKMLQDLMIFFICAQEIKDKKHIIKIIAAVSCGIILSSVDGLWQIKFGRDFIRGYEPILNIGLTRATAAFGNSNVFGVYLSAVVTFILGLAIYYFRGAKKILMLAIGILGAVGVAITYSRGTALGLYLGILFISICRKNKTITILLLVFLMIFPFIMPKQIKDWAKSINYNPIVFMCNDDRISIYRNTENMIKHHPFVGVGVNTFCRNYLKYKVAEPYNAMTGDSMYAHNNFLQMAGEIGLVGLAIFLIFLMLFFRECANIYNNLRDEYCRVILLSLCAGLIAFLINGLTETTLYYARVAMIFWYFIGFSLALKKFIPKQ